MKITIDETIFNKALYDGKIEVAEWLLENGCPSNDTAYIQNFDPKVLCWLKNRNIPMSKHCLAQVISKTRQEEVITWFVDNGAQIDNNAILACIQYHANSLFAKFLSKVRIPLGVEAFKTAVLSENITMLDYLNNLGCLYDESITETAMKHKKKESLKWLVLNDKF